MDERSTLFKGNRMQLVEILLSKEVSQANNRDDVQRRVGSLSHTALSLNRNRVDRY